MLTGAERMAGLNTGIDAEHNARARRYKAVGGSLDWADLQELIAVPLANNPQQRIATSP
jgi:hypothetical protein